MKLYIVYRDFQWLVFCDFSLAFQRKRQHSVSIHCTWLLTCFNLIYQFSVNFKILEQWGIRCECEIYLLPCLRWSEKYQLIFEEIIKPCLHILCRYFISKEHLLWGSWSSSNGNMKYSMLLIIFYWTLKVQQ